jgi:large exoprotein involved in heme utilization and adhesion
VDQALEVLGSGQISADTFSRGNGGNLTIQAGSLSIDGSATPSNFTGISADSNQGATGNAGDLTITVDQALSVVGSGQISAGTSSRGNGGNLTIQAGSLSIDGSATRDHFTGLASESNPGATGNAGDLNIVVDQALKIVGHGQIAASTFSSGNAGNLTIHAGSLSLDGSATPDAFTGIGADTQGSGKAGDLTITVDRALSIAGHGEIEVITSSSGKGGSLTIHAGSLSIDGSATPAQFTGIASDSNPGATGDAGDLNILVDQALTIVGHGQIGAGTFSTGDAGNLTIHAGSLSLDGSATPHVFTGIDADTQGSGDAGNLTITVDRALSIAGHGEIEVSTFSSGKGGDVSVNAESIFIDNAGQRPDSTGIFAEAHNIGKGGTIAVNAGDVLLQNGGSISAESLTSAAAGSVQLRLGTLTVDSGSSISSANTGSGEAGSVLIHTDGSVRIKHDSSISTLSDMSDAGSIEIKANGAIKLKDQSTITVSGGHNGGDIDITTPDLLYLLNSSITATAGASGVNGAGGNIKIDHPQFIVLNHSFISANAAIGQGGNINLVSDFFFNSDLSNDNITATGTTNGTVNISAPALDLGSELITLPTSLLSAESQLQERCTALLRGDFSSFISIGRGGTEPAPEELQITF